MSASDEDKKDPQKVLERKIPQYIIGAFSLVVALSWRDVVNELFARYGGDADQSIKYKIIYSVVITILLGFIVYLVYTFNAVYHNVKKHISHKIDVYRNGNLLAILHSDNFTNPTFKGYVYARKLNSNELVLKINIRGLDPQSVYQMEFRDVQDYEQYISATITTQSPYPNIVSNEFGDIVDKQIILREQGGDSQILSGTMEKLNNSTP